MTNTIHIQHSFESHRIGRTCPRVLTTGRITITRPMSSRALAAGLLLSILACDHRPGSNEASTDQYQLRQTEFDEGPTHYILPDCASEVLEGHYLRLEEHECSGDDETKISQILATIEPGDVVTSAKEGHSYVRVVTESGGCGRHLKVEEGHFGHVAHARGWARDELDELGRGLGDALADDLSGNLSESFSGENISDSNSFDLFIDNEHVSFEPEFVFDVDRNGSILPNYFRMELGGKLQASASVELEANVEVTDLEEELEEALVQVKLYESGEMWELVMVGEVPVATVTTLEVTLSGGVAGHLHAQAEATIGINEHGETFRVGAEYDGGWKALTPSYDAIEPYIRDARIVSEGEIRLDFEITATATVDLYDLEGAKLSLIPHGEVKIREDTAAGRYGFALEGGIDGAVGLDMNVPGPDWFGDWLENKLEQPFEFPILPNKVLVPDGPVTRPGDPDGG